MMRIGIGYDVHRLVPGRELVLGGIQIPWEKGLEGHSDADVLVHAIMDAMLGALALGDIGHLFPDGEQQWKGVSSLILLQLVNKHIRERGYRVSNVDAVLMAQAPKIAGYVNAMREILAGEMGIQPSQVGIKATTTEGLGFVGEEKGMAAQAVVLLEAFK